MLRLVHPPAGGNGADPPKRRRRGPSPSMSLTPDEAAFVRAALRNVARAYGGMDVLASVIGVPVDSLYQAARRPHRPSGILVIRLAQAAGISVEAILTGALNPAGRCPTCGSRAGDGRLVTVKGGAR